MPSYLWIRSQESKRFMCSEEESVTEVRVCLSCKGNTLGRRGPGRPWDGRRRQRSPCAGLLQAFIEPEMLFLPIRRPNLDRSARIESFESERFQFLRSLLISTDKALQIGFDGESMGFRAGADFGFEVGMRIGDRGDE